MKTLKQIEKSTNNELRDYLQNVNPEQFREEMRYFLNKKEKITKILIELQGDMAEAILECGPPD